MLEPGSQTAQRLHNLAEFTSPFVVSLLNHEL